EERAALVLIASDRRLQPLGKVAVEDIGLAHHRPDTAHLEHQPLDDQGPPLAIRGQELPRLLGEVDHDGARLEDGEVVRVAVDDGRNATIRVDAEELGLLLVAGEKVHDVDLVRNAELLERDGRLVPVRGGSGVEVDHRSSFPAAVTRVNPHPPADLKYLANAATPPAACRQSKHSFGA